MGRRMTSAERRHARRSSSTEHRRMLKAQRSRQRPPVVPWTALQNGVLIDVALDFKDDVRSWKRRPAVVVSVADRQVVIYECTTQLRRHPEQLRLRDWRDAALADPTGVWLRRRTIDRSNILGVRGALSAHDLRRVHRIGDALAFEL